VVDVVVREEVRRWKKRWTTDPKPEMRKMKEAAKGKNKLKEIPLSEPKLQ